MHNYYYAAYKAILEDKTCPNCGMTTQELMEKGKIGCNHCTQIFRPELEAIVSRLQGRTKFSGRIPQSLVEILEKNFNLSETEAKLRLAIEEERYEDAAVYRDLIRELKKSADGDSDGQKSADGDAGALALPQLGEEV